MKRGICKECGVERNLENVRLSLCPVHNKRRLQEKNPPKKYALKKRSYLKWYTKKDNDKRRTVNERKDLRAELDRVFSLFIRKKYGPKCYTCTDHAIDCGHFQLRGNDATRWHEDNARPQCRFKCNGIGEGEPEVFRRNLVEEIGQARVLEVERLAKSTAKFSQHELKELLESYKTKMKSL